MSAEESSIFDEINEEIKRDEFLKFLKKHQNMVSWVVILVVAGIIGHSAWYSNKKKRLEMATTSLYNEIYSSPMKSEAGEKKSKAVFENLIQNAPSELVPLISLIKTGREIGTAADTSATAKQLLELSEKRGVDVVWRDLAVLMYVSYKLEPDDKSLERLQKLAEGDRPFRFTAMEKIAMIHANRKESDKAIEILTKIIDNKEAPDTLKKRVAKVINYMKNHENDKSDSELSVVKEENSEAGGIQNKDMKNKSVKSGKAGKSGRAGSQVGNKLNKNGKKRK
ncbi:MAG: tetratricopeptide repeat protein [Alphaproteobacteria bacterium]|nr:tetratricopeptide repeat protein [Alphaproteobacteria bacterium]